MASGIDDFAASIGFPRMMNAHALGSERVLYGKMHIVIRNTTILRISSAGHNDLMLIGMQAYFNAIAAFIR